MTGTAKHRGETVWGWVIRLTGLALFVDQAVIRDKDVNFGIAFLAISMAALPLHEFSMFLKSWWNRRGGDS